MQFKSQLGALLLILLIPGANVPAQDPEPVLHAVSSEELRLIMRRMNQLVYEREMTILQTQALRAQNLDDLLDTVSDLLFSAENLNMALPGFGLDREDKAIFRALTSQLVKEATLMKTLAEEEDYMGVDSVYKELEDTCNACHRLFRY